MVDRVDTRAVIFPGPGLFALVGDGVLDLALLAADAGLTRAYAGVAADGVPTAERTAAERGRTGVEPACGDGEERAKVVGGRRPFRPADWGREVKAGPLNPPAAGISFLFALEFGVETAARNRRNSAGIPAAYGLSVQERDFV